ncbi:MAG: hypothetical protein MJ248_04990, partial [Bacilli bacterium]|nr:hypothetical protein [Bacilli bacterium]
MKQSIPSILYQGIQGNHWVEITYNNSKGKQSFFTIGIKDIDVKNKKIICDIFNLDYETYGGECMKFPSPLLLESITKARVMEQSYYPTPKSLSTKLNNDVSLQELLEARQLDNNILSYLSDCYRFDNDPYIHGGTTLDGIDLSILKKDKLFHLDDKQFKSLIDEVFKESDLDKQLSTKTLAMNVVSISRGNKSYVIAYRPITLNFKDRNLNLGNHSIINKSFLVEGQKMSLSSFIDVSPEEFIDNFDEKTSEFINDIRANIRENQMVDTRPIFFLI